MTERGFVAKPVRAPKTSELVAADLRRQIVDGTLAPGSMLPSESELMAQYTISRPTLREAFRILEMQTLITVRRGARGGGQVTEPDSSLAGQYVGLLLQLRGTTLADVYEARMLIEPYCVRLLAQARTERDLLDLEENQRELLEALADGDDAPAEAREWGALTYRFHELIFTRCGNRTLAVQCELLVDIVRSHMASVVAHLGRTGGSSHEPRQMARAHAKLIRLLRAREAEAAETHWRAHLEAAAEVVFAAQARDTTVIDLFG